MRIGMLTTMALLGLLRRSRIPWSRSRCSATISSWRQAMRNVGEFSKTGLGLCGRSLVPLITTAGADTHTSFRSTNKYRPQEAAGLSRGVRVTIDGAYLAE